MTRGRVNGRPAWLIGILIGGVLFAVIGLWFYLGHLPTRTRASFEAAGQFGDSFGYVNSLFSGLALAGVIIAILLQTKELNLQRFELEQTTDALKQSAAAHQEAQDSLKLQTFLNTCNLLMEVWSKDIDSHSVPAKEYSRAHRGELQLVVQHVLTELLAGKAPGVIEFDMVKALTTEIRAQARAARAALMHAPNDHITHGVVKPIALDLRSRLRTIRKTAKPIPNCGLIVLYLDQEIARVDVILSDQPGPNPSTDFLVILGRLAAYSGSAI